MNETQAVFLLITALLALALYRRPDSLTLTLAAAFGAAMAVAAVWPPETRLPVTVALDGAVVAMAARLARVHLSDRAAVVVGIGTLKVEVALAAAYFGIVQHVRAAGVNSAFIIQVLVAGGMANGIMAWVGHRAGRLVDLRRRVLGIMGV